MYRWGDFAREQPVMAEGGRALLYQFGPGLGYLATVRRDGAPRLHPFCPVILGEGLYGLILPTSPKCHDLRRDGRYAIHTFPKAEGDDEFMVSGRAVLAEERTEEVRAAFLSHEGTTSTGDEACFEFLIDRALLALYTPRAEGPSWPPAYTKWQARA